MDSRQGLKDAWCSGLRGEEQTDQKTFLVFEGIAVRQLTTHSFIPSSIQRTLMCETGANKEKMGHYFGQNLRGSGSFFVHTLAEHLQGKPMLSISTFSESIARCH